MARRPFHDGILAMTLAERRRWAERRGNPAWLWPEVAIGDWQAALEDISCVLSARLSGRGTPSFPRGGLALCLAAYSSGTGPLLGSWIEGGSVSADGATSELLFGHLEANRIRMAGLELAAKQAFSLLDRAGIPAIALKGMDTAYSLFASPPERPMADLDILVPAGRLIDALGILGLPAEAPGWGETTLRPPGQDRDPHSLFRLEAGDPWSIDLHHRLDYLVAPPRVVARLDRAGPFAACRRHAVIEGARVLAEPARLLHLAVHAGSGLHSLTLLRQYEIVLAIRQGECFGALDWVEFLDLAERCEALGFAYPALAMAEKLAPGTVPESVAARCRGSCPRRAVALVDGLLPATAHRVARQSLREHFMWSSGMTGTVRRAVADIRPASSWKETAAIYRRRLWQAARGVPSG